MTLFRQYTISRASTLRRKLDDAIANGFIDDPSDIRYRLYWFLEGSYNSRLFGLVFYRNNNKYYDAVPNPHTNVKRD